MLFDPDTVATGEVQLVDDLPGGSARLYADAIGVQRVIVNGTTIVESGHATGALPGTVLRSGPRHLHGADPRRPLGPAFNAEIRRTPG